MAKTYTQITAANLIDFPIGSKVRFNYGAMCGSEDGLIVDFEIDRWGAHVIVETEKGETKSVQGFTTVGIGAYLL